MFLGQVALLSGVPLRHARDGDGDDDAGRDTAVLGPRVGVIRSFLFNHWSHHRGRLVVYLRRLDVPVPSVYGATAEALREAHVRPMDFTGKPLTGFVYVSAAGIDTAVALRRWIAFGQQGAARPTATTTARAPRRRRG
jgi:hypothetical protein